MKAAVARRPKPDLARDLLNAPHLDTRSTEIFPVSDLAGVGLARYLGEGYTVPESETAPDSAKLEALDGYVLLLFSDSFGGAATTLDPGPAVTLIGTYCEAAADHSATRIETPSAAPYSGTAPAPTTPVERRHGSSLVAGILVMIVLAVLWWAMS
jgi:hypothetical protein